MSIEAHTAMETAFDAYLHNPNRTNAEAVSNAWRNLATDQGPVAYAMLIRAVMRSFDENTGLSVSWPFAFDPLSHINVVESVKRHCFELDMYVNLYLQLKTLNQRNEDYAQYCKQVTSVQSTAYVALPYGRRAFLVGVWQYLLKNHPDVLNSLNNLVQDTPAKDNSWQSANPLILMINMNPAISQTIDNASAEQANIKQVLQQLVDNAKESGDTPVLDALTKPAIPYAANENLDNKHTSVEAPRANKNDQRKKDKPIAVKMRIPLAFKELGRRAKLSKQSLETYLDDPALQQFIQNTADSFYDYIMEEFVADINQPGSGLTLTYPNVSYDAQNLALVFDFETTDRCQPTIKSKILGALSDGWGESAEQDDCDLKNYDITLSIPFASIKPTFDITELRQ